ncbi:YhgE/Pip domain-containing protein [Alkalihalobacillus sp. LMS39]|uniref:YhgE/Pip domain-containing protein n=1 Tax=Alkalihalobacillus sp. LMS39 TaxID=2924032 RepID=UPI00326082BE
MRKKQLWLIVLALLLLLPSFLVQANQTDESQDEGTSTMEQTDGKLASKDEVVYALLQATGELEQVYVVNNLNIREAGTIIDYGPYDSVKNLTDLTELEHEDDVVRIEASKGKFFYQGNIEQSVELPWNIEVAYKLDGKEIAPEQLINQDGHFEMTIQTTANENGEQLFYENYILQISVMLESDIFNNIEVTDGMIANVGKNQQVTFTAMPEQDGEYYLAADVTQFEMQGIEIAAVPSSMAIDPPDIDNMTEDMDSLTDAIRQLNEGVGELKAGVVELNDGVEQLRNGSQQYQNGMIELNKGSSELVNASKSIDEALATISQSLADADDVDMSELVAVADGLNQIAGGLNETADGLALLRENYNMAYNALDGAISGIPDHNISREEIDALIGSGADTTVVDKLVETYNAARSVKRTYNQFNEAFRAVDATLRDVSGALKEMGTTLSTIANGLSASVDEMGDTNGFAELQNGLSQLSANYGEFHSGLVSYTNGVGELSNSYGELHSGIVELANGTTELESGVGELQDGTGTLYESTSDLPEQMQEEIDNMIAEYDKSDFEAVSFVSPKNEKVNSVQFVIRTDSLKIEEQETETDEAPEEKTFWDRLRELFS